MTVVALLAVRGAPGVTTTAVAMGAVWPDDRRVRLLEADPAGGVLAVRYNLTTSRGLAALAAAARRASQPGLVDEYAQALPGGLPVVVAPLSGDHVAASLAGLGERLAVMLRRDTADTLVDCGRFTASSPTRAVVESADVVIVVTRPDAEGLASTHLACRSLRGTGRRVHVVAVGDRPYPATEAASVLGVAVATIADDPRAATALSGKATTRGLARSALIRSARSVAADIATADPRADGTRAAGVRYGAGAAT